MSGMHCRHCGRLGDSQKVCGCPESLGAAAAQSLVLGLGIQGAILQSIIQATIVRYTVKLHRTDNSEWDIFPAYTGEFINAINFVREKMKDGQYDKAQIEGGLETWDLHRVPA